MESFRKRVSWPWLLAGVALAAIIGWALLWIANYSLVAGDRMVELQQRVGVLEEENRKLSKDPLRSGALLAAPHRDADLPYDDLADAGLAVAQGRERALQEGKFLMVTFGANWCLDCRTLYRHLQSEEVASYARNLFHFVHVNVGKFNQNRALAEELGVDLRKGIPVAIFFDPDGRSLGTTNDGQLEPARRYSSKQILKFVRDVAERSLIAAPDAVN